VDIAAWADARRSIEGTSRASRRPTSRTSAPAICWIMICQRASARPGLGVRRTTSEKDGLADTPAAGAESPTPLERSS